ncbi:MAG: P1 family peptidase [Candidatus Sumerlaeaceae bacterium]|nr:P1 family peptidase [Candidatus Sumerlaeaceae bacterium]
MMRICSRGVAVFTLVLLAAFAALAQPAEKENRLDEPAMRRLRAREMGLQPGVLPPGPLNAITDIPDVRVGHRTLIHGDSVRTGVTVIVPHGGNIFREKVPAAVYAANGFGKLAGSTQVQELGTLETPIALTNTLAVGTGVTALVQYTLKLPGNEDVRSVNAFVGETNDSYLNDIRGLHLTVDDFLLALEAATTGPVAEGSVGAGTGTTCFGFKGGVGTASRVLPEAQGGWTVGVLVQSNYGGSLTVCGAPVGRELQQKGSPDHMGPSPTDGSCMIVVATNAPLCPRNLGRLAKRAVLGLARTGSCLENGSGDYAVAFTTAYRIPEGGGLLDPPVALVANRAMNTLFMATVEATEEAVYNSLFAATTVTGVNGHKREAIPLDRVLEICRRYGVVKSPNHAAEGKQ